MKRIAVLVQVCNYNCHRENQNCQGVFRMGDGLLQYLAKS